MSVGVTDAHEGWVHAHWVAAIARNVECGGVSLIKVMTVTMTVAVGPLSNAPKLLSKHAADWHFRCFVQVPTLDQGCSVQGW